MPDIPAHCRSFPGCVATACRRIGHSTGELYPQELALISKAIDKRRREFAAGRACAREALGAIGYAPMPILQAASEHRSGRMVSLAPFRTATPGQALLLRGLSIWQESALILKPSAAFP